MMTGIGSRKSVADKEIRDKQPIRDLNLKELTKVVEGKGYPKYRAKQLADWIYSKQILKPEEAKNVPKDLIESLSKDFTFSALGLVEVTRSADGSNKFLFKTQRGEYIESVYIHQASERHALCLSTQVGCKMACRFCASGKLGWERNLSAGEILDQVAHVVRKLNVRIDNIIFMGMGEPLDNLDAVLKSIKGLRADWGFRMGWRRITVSTSGLIPGIKRLAKAVGGEVKLAISLHGTTEESRQKLMPINKAYSLKDLIICLQDVQKTFKRQFTFEFILIKDVNDSMKDAQRLERLAKRVNAKVNLIPYNKIEGETFERPPLEKMKQMQKYLTDHDVITTLRYSAGSDINAACGQLRLIHEKGKTS